MEWRGTDDVRASIEWYSTFVCHLVYFFQPCFGCGWRKNLMPRDEKERNTLEDGTTHIPHTFGRVRRRTEHTENSRRMLYALLFQR